VGLKTMLWVCGTILPFFFRENGKNIFRTKTNSRCAREEHETIIIYIYIYHRVSLFIARGENTRCIYYIYRSAATHFLLSRAKVV